MSNSFVTRKILNSFLDGNEQRATINCELVSARNTKSSVTITEADIVQNSMTIDRYCCSGDKIEIGSAIASEMKLELLNYDKRFNQYAFEGAKLTVTVHIDTEDGTANIPMGVFWIDNCPRKLTKISLTALDGMVKFDYPLTAFYNKYPVGTAIKVSVLIDYLCELRGISRNQLNADLNKYFSDSKNLYVTIPELDSQETCRTFLQYACAILGGCAYMDWNGDFRVQPYHYVDGARLTDNQRLGLITADERFSSDLFENEISVTGVQAVVNQNESEQVYIAGTDDYVLNLENNRLIDGSNAQQIVNGVYNLFEGFTYRPFEAVTKPYPHIMPLDIVRFRELKEGNDTAQDHDTIVTHTTFHLNGNMEIKGTGKTETENGYASVNAFTAKQRAMLKNLEEKNTARYDSLVELNDIITSAMGLYSNIETDENGGKIYYYFSCKSPPSGREPTLSDISSGDIVYKINGGGMVWSTNYNGEDTVWRYGITKDGNAILNMLKAYKITADIIETGLLKSNDTSTYFDLDNNTLVIANYGKNSAVTAGAYSTKLSSGLIEFSGATSNGALGRTGKIRTGYTKSGSTYTGKHFAIGYISNSSGEGADGAHSMKLGAFDSKTDQFTTLMQLSGSEGVVVSEDTSATLSNKRNHFESNTLHNSNAEFVSGNSFSVGLKHFSVSKNNTTYAWRQHYFGSYIDSSYNHWTGWQAYNSNSEFEHSFSTLKMSDSTVGVRFAVGSSAAYLRVVTSGTPGVYFRKNYDTATDFSNAMNIYAGNGNFADVYVNSGLSSPVSVTGLHTRLATLENLGLSGLSSNVTANTNRCSDIYGILGSTKINGETHSMQLSRFKYLFGNGDTAGSNDVWRLIFKEYGTAARANIGCSATKNIGFYKGSDSSTYTNIYAANINSSSTQDCKKNISTASVDALSLVENSKIYNFDYKNEGDDETLETSSVIDSDEDIGADYGFVIERETPDEVLSDDGTAVNLYSMISLNWKATQQLLERVKALEGGSNNGH